MHKVTYALLRGCYAVTSAMLAATILMLLFIKTDTTSVSHTLMLAREMCATGAVVLLISVIGSAILHERLST